MPAHIKRNVKRSSHVRLWRRKRLLVKKARKKGKIRIFWYIIILAILAAPLAYLFLARQYWEDDAKLSLAIREDNGDVVVATFDPTADEIISLTVPGNTEVSVAHGLGVWKLRSVWKLGENEGFNGKLLAETLTRHFKFPTVAWADSTAMGFTSKSPLALIRASFLPYKTNLKVGDRIALALFAFQIGNTKRVDINLAETSYLKKTTFVDGEEGYIIAGTPSPALSAIFADPEISRKAFVVVIRDATSGGEVAYEVGKVLEVIGAKVASIVKEREEALDCIVSGKDDVEVKKVARLLSCSASKMRLEGSFDLEVKVGEDFAKRF